MSPELVSMLYTVLSSEEVMRLHEQHEMNQAHKLALQGFKRFHRYRAMDRGKHSVMLQCFIVENFHQEPQLNIMFTTPSSSMTLADSLRFMHDKGLSHIELLEKCLKMAYEEGECLLGGYLDKMVVDQSKEVDAYYRLWMDVRRENADLNYLSDKLHKKYKRLEKK